MTRGVFIPPFERLALSLKNINGVSNVRFLFYTLLKELLYYNERGYRIKKSDSPKVCHPEHSEGSYSAICLFILHLPCVI